MLLLILYRKGLVGVLYPYPFSEYISTLFGVHNNVKRKIHRRK